MKKYILIGIPNCGKTTLGRRTAEILQMPFFDTDTMAYNKLKIVSPLDLFRPSTTARLEIEQLNAIVELAKLDYACIIATGAEVALMPNCARLIRNMGTIIYIQRKVELVFADLKEKNRSSLIMRDETDGTEINMREEAVELYAEEISQYEDLADLILDNDGTEDEGVEKLITLINLT